MTCLSEVLGDPRRGHGGQLPSFRFRQTEGIAEFRRSGKAGSILQPMHAVSKHHMQGRGLMSRAFSTAVMSAFMVSSPHPEPDNVIGCLARQIIRP